MVKLPPNGVIFYGTSYPNLNEFSTEIYATDKPNIGIFLYFYQNHMYHVFTRNMSRFSG